MMSQSSSKAVYEILGRHPVHPFPARMAPDVALDIVTEYRAPLCVLDPMSGSGTVLAIARSKGHRAVGVDIDPLAVLISRVWTTAIDREEVRKRAADVLDESRGVFASLRVRDAYPADSDDETRRFVRYWFDDYARRQLASLAVVIRDVGEDTVREALWCAFFSTHHCQTVWSIAGNGSVAQQAAPALQARAREAVSQVPVGGGPSGRKLHREAGTFNRAGYDGMRRRCQTSSARRRNCRSGSDVASVLERYRLLSV